MLLLDASALVDYLEENSKGTRIKGLLAKEDFYVCPVTFAELSKWCYQQDLSVDKIFRLILAAGNRVHETNETIEKRAGEMCARLNEGKARHEQKVSLIDCIVAATAEYYGLVLIATDPDFNLFDQEKIIVS